MNIFCHNANYCQQRSEKLVKRNWIDKDTNIFIKKTGKGTGNKGDKIGETH